MDPLHVVEKCTKEIINHFHLPHKICFPFIKKVISWVYVAGWEEGRQQRSKRQPVIQMDEYGNIIEIHKSLSAAARKVKVDKSNISKALTNNHHSAGGFLWKMVNDPKEIHKIIEGWQDEL